MRVVNLLEFLNKTKDLCTLEYTVCESKLVNFLDLIAKENKFIQKIDFGVIFVTPKPNDKYILIDGKSRILSLSLLLHAVCECYKKTTAQNETAIRTIRKKYLLQGDKTKLKLAPDLQIIYDKIIFGERLSGKEKENPMFVLLHNFWVQIKEEKLQAASIFKMLQKIVVFVVEVDNQTIHSDLYYSLNKDKRELKQIPLIENYLKTIGLNEDWNKIKMVYNNNDADMSLFFKDFFVTKFDFKDTGNEHLYENFLNYFESMLHLMPEDMVMAKIKLSAMLYKKILNVNLDSEALKAALIQIKLHKGEDTYAYLLKIYEDYVKNNITEEMFLEILNTIDEYLQNRLKTPNNVSFNELIQYLDAYLSCK